MRALVLERNPRDLDLLQGFLRTGAVDCVAADGAGDALSILTTQGEGAFDIVIADGNGGAGWKLLAELRDTGDGTPVILTCHELQSNELVRALRMGADDLIAKPPDREEFLARVESVVRRRLSLPVLRIGELAVDLGRRTVLRGRRRIELSPREFDLLRVLTEARGRPRSRSQLFHEIWGADFEPATTVVEVLVARLRRKLDAQDLPPLIQTIPGQGYRLVAGAAG